MFSGIIRRLSEVSLWYFVLIAFALSELLTAVMSLILRGGITYDYLITGGVVSVIVASFVIYFIRRLRETEAAYTRLQREVAARKRVEDELQQSEEKYRTLVENINDVIFTINNEGKFTFFTQNVEEFIGYSPEELVGRHFIEVLTPEGAKIAVERFKRALKGEALPKIEYEIVKKDGGSLIAELSMSTLFEDGKPVGRLGIARDITERKRLYQKLLHSMKLASVGQLAAGVAHEINTPLTNISLITEALREKSSSGADGRKLESILEQIAIISKIVNNLLDFSRLTEPKTGEVDLSQLLEKALDMLSVKLKNVEVKKEYRSGLLVSGDPNQLLQVFVNLILNASQAMPHGGELSIEAKCDKGFIETIISDTGSGIAAKDIPNVFDPFFTTKGHGRGTGLGLSIARGIIEGHGGDIRVESEVGIGSTFMIILPAGGKNA